MSTERADFTKEFLTTNPQVAYSLFQAMVMMNLVDPSLVYVKYPPILTIDWSNLFILNEIALYDEKLKQTSQCACYFYTTITAS
jgi:hypothetical protein